MQTSHPPTSQNAACLWRPSNRLPHGLCGGWTFHGCPCFSYSPLCRRILNLRTLTPPHPGPPVSPLPTFRTRCSESLPSPDDMLQPTYSAFRIGEAAGGGAVEGDVRAAGSKSLHLCVWSCVQEDEGWRRDPSPAIISARSWSHCLGSERRYTCHLYASQTGRSSRRASRPLGADRPEPGRSREQTGRSPRGRREGGAMRSLGGARLAHL